MSGCPADSAVTFPGRRVTWIEPVASDISDNVTITKSLSPGAYIKATTLVTYTFTDLSGNRAYCNFTVDIECTYVLKMLFVLLYNVLRDHPWVFFLSIDQSELLLWVQSLLSKRKPKLFTIRVKTFARLVLRKMEDVFLLLLMYFWRLFSRSNVKWFHGEKRKFWREICR